MLSYVFFFSSRRRHTRFKCDWSSDVCSSDLHTKVLFERWWTVGLDLSMALLKVARKESPDAPYVRADMRDLPFADETFDLVVNLFTSFGYFDDDREHLRVLSCVAAAMRRGGTLVIDFLNA